MSVCMSVLHSQLLGTIDVLSYGRLCTTELWKDGNVSDAVACMCCIDTYAV